jgi:hypothetical protein
VPPSCPAARGKPAPCCQEPPSPGNTCSCSPIYLDPGIHLAACNHCNPLPPPSSFQASGYTGDPLALSYWAASNLPLGPSTRQQLLAAPHAGARLRLLLLLLGELGALCCRRCGAGLAAAGDTLKLSPEGIGGTFVNSAG